MTPYGAEDIVNPLRGQFDNLGTGLFPQHNSAQTGHPAWPGTADSSNRFEWKQLQPTDPRTVPTTAPDSARYDFTTIDNAIAIAASQGRRYGFRVTMFNSCCQALTVGSVNSSVPDWLRTVQGATGDFTKDGIYHVIPNWNNEAYLSYTTDLIAALGRRYNKDERVAIYEMSGYGDFSENHVSFMSAGLGIPGPDLAHSVSQLGYAVDWQDQYITKASIARLVDATLTAFPDTRITVAPANAEIVKQLFRDSPKLSGLARPVGLRSDCLGAYAINGEWTASPWAYYPSVNDPILPIIRDRWKTAPIQTEWCNFLNGQTESTYFDRALTDVVNQHVAMTASTGHPYDWQAVRMPDALFAKWVRASKYSGYRFAMTAATVPNSARRGQSLPITVQWSNFGVTPTYDRWTIVYQVLRNDVVVLTVPSTVNTQVMAPAQNYTNTSADPQPLSASETVTIPTSGLATGKYTVRAQVVWAEHKPGATNVVDYAPMRLAQAGRANDGSYPVGSFSVRLLW